MRRFISGTAQFHTNEPDPNKPDKALKPYLTVTWAEVMAMADNPQAVDKTQSQWLIPSSHPSRSFAEQERLGQYGLLWADIDHNPKGLDGVLAIVLGFIGAADAEIYTSRSATEENQKCRVLIPIVHTLPFADWSLAQETLNDKLAQAGIEPDRASERAAQLCYLPNRGAYYRNLGRRDGTAFDPMAAWADEIAAKKAEIAAQQAETEKAKTMARARRETLTAAGHRDIYAAFNAVYTPMDWMVSAGYAQRGNTFRHPNSSSGNYSAGVRQADGVWRVHSLSTSDPLYSGGHGGGAHDAFSTFAILVHGGDRDAALKDAGDNHLTIDGMSWNKVVRREFKGRQAEGDTGSATGDQPTQGQADGGEDLITRLQRRYIYLGRIGKYYDTKTDAEVLCHALSGSYQHENSEKSSVSTQLLASPKTIKVDGITYHPGRPNGSVKYSGGVFWNIWEQPESHLPAVAGDADVKPWLEHCRYIVPNDSERGYLLDWMAFIAQHPGVKVNSAILLSGKTRVGKDLLLNPLRVAVGRENVSEPSAETLKEKYTDYLHHAKLVIFQEIHSFEGLQVEDKLKPMLASPPDDLIVRMFGTGFYKCPNLVQAVFMSNHPTSALHISEGDGRYFTIWSPAERKGESYYANFTEWQRGGGDEKAARWLLSRDVSNFNPKSNAPMTEYKAKLQEESRSSLQRELRSKIEAFDYPFNMDIVRAEDIPPHLSERNAKSPIVANALVEVGCLGRTCRRVVGKRPRLELFAVRNVGEWQEKEPRQWLLEYDSRGKPP